MRSKILVYSYIFLAIVSPKWGKLIAVPSQRTHIETACGVVVGIAALYYLTAPDTSMPQFDDLNVCTFLPTDKPKDAFVSSKKADIFACIKRRAGVILVNGKYYRIHQGIPEEIGDQERVFIYSSGVCNSGPSAACVYREIKGGAISGPCVVFEYVTHTRRAFNFCQEQDQECLRLVYDDLLAKAPDTKVVLFGICKGSANALRFVHQKNIKRESVDRISAVIAESPINSWAEGLSYPLTGGPMLHVLSRLLLPNYNSQATILDEAAPFSNTVPVLIGSTPCDTFSQLSDIEKLVERLRGNGFCVEHFVCSGKDSDIMHGKIGSAVSWQKKVSSFLNKLP